MCVLGVGVSDEVRAPALKLCQEVCVWDNELGEEALSQEAWPREGARGAGISSSQTRYKRFTHHRSAGAITHCSQAGAVRACAERAPACCACIHQ